MDQVTNKDITDYFRSNMFEAYSSYLAWKMITYSRSTVIFSKEMAERYVEIQNYHSDFFGSAQSSFLMNFVMRVLHAFDSDPRSYSLRKVNKEKTEKFIENNSEVIDSLYVFRDQEFAHKDMRMCVVAPSPLLPSSVQLDHFFKNLFEFYNDLTLETDKSHTVFDNAENIKRDIENLFINLYRGEAIKIKEIDIDTMWDKNPRKASDVL